MAEIKAYTDDHRLDFGSHKGEALANIPASWFLWFWKETHEGKKIRDPRLKLYIQENMELLQKEAKKDQNLRKFLNK